MDIASTAAGSALLLTQRLRFPLTVSGGLYRLDLAGTAQSWQWLSPQDRHAVPVASIGDVLPGPGETIVLRVAGGDGAALVRSTDQGLSWQPIFVPKLLSPAGTVQLNGMLAVTPSGYKPGRSPGLVSHDGGKTWQPLGVPPRAPTRTGLRAVLTAYPSEGVLALDLVSVGALSDAVPLAAYTSSDGGRTWRIPACGALPVAGCTAPGLWSRTSTARYALYRGRLYQASNGHPWRILSLTMPAVPAAVIQVLAVAGQRLDTLYVVGPDGIWQLQGDGSWRNLAMPLGLGPRGVVM